MSFTPVFLGLSTIPYTYCGILYIPAYGKLMPSKCGTFIDWIENQTGGFGYDENWRYYRANVLSPGKDKGRAIGLYKAIAIRDQKYLPARYQLAMTYYDQKEYGQAAMILRTILSKTPQEMSTLPRSEKARPCPLAWAPG